MSSDNEKKAIYALCEALARLDSAEAMHAFLVDLSTPAELRALAERWQVARLLDQGEMSYREIHDQTGVSTTTISRVARFLRHEPYQGYRHVIDKMNENL